MCTAVGGPVHPKGVQVTQMLRSGLCAGHSSSSLHILANRVLLDVTLCMGQGHAGTRVGFLFRKTKLDLPSRMTILLLYHCPNSLSPALTKVVPWD